MHEDVGDVDDKYDEDNDLHSRNVFKAWWRYHINYGNDRVYYEQGNNDDRLYLWIGECTSHNNQDDKVNDDNENFTADHNDNKSDDGVDEWYR